MFKDLTNKEQKQEILKDYDMLDIAREWTKLAIINNYGIALPLKYEPEHITYMYEFFTSNPHLMIRFKTCLRILAADKSRKHRLNRYVKCMFIFPKLIFVTLTFNEKELSVTSSETRRKLISRYLKSQCRYYIANKDFGGENNREHYHALAIPYKRNMLDLQAYRDIFHDSNINVKIVRNRATPHKLATYISKLTNHQLKETAVSDRIIYSRALPELLNILNLD